MNLNDIQTAAGAAVIVAIVMQTLKSLVPERWVPATAILVGVALVIGATGVVGQGTAEDLGHAALTGFLAGASSVGLYAAQRPVPLRGGGPLMGPREEE